MPLAFVVILLLASFSIKAEICYVAFVKGKILKAGTPVKIGDALDVNNSTELEFSSSNDIVVVVMPNKGRYVIRAKIVRTSQNKLWVLVKDNLIPCTQRNSLTARGTGLDLTEFLKGGRLAIFKKTLIPIDKSFWMDRDRNYFYLKYNVDKATIEKKLIFLEPSLASDTLKLVLDDNIFSADGNKIQSRDVTGMTLYFYEKDAAQSIKIKDLKVTELSDDTVFPEIKNTYVLIYSYLHQDPSSVQSELKTHIEEFYGRIDKESMHALLSTLDTDRTTK